MLDGSDQPQSGNATPFKEQRTKGAANGQKGLLRPTAFKVTGPSRDVPPTDWLVQSHKGDKTRPLPPCLEEHSTPLS